MGEGNNEGTCEFWTKAKLFRTPSFIEYHTVVCRRPKMENSRFCVFHTAVEKKQPRDFWFEFFKELNAIKRIRLGGNTWRADCYFKDFIGFEFPDIQYYFWNTVFDHDVRFDGAKFRGPAIFNNVTFKKDVSFENAEFHDTTIFLSPVFEGRAEFEGAIFKNPQDPKTRGLYVPLTACTFKGKTSFKNTVFETGVDLTKSVFEDEVIFEGTDLRGVNYFVSVTFAKGANFKVRRGPQGEKANVFFLDVKTRPGVELVFKDMNLSGWALTHTRAIENAVFLHVDWEDKNELRRKHTWDEIVARGNITGVRESITYDDVAEVYRRLRLNYENRLAYEGASDFHIGQMEMMLKNPATNPAKKVFLSLYKLFSNYGENVITPIYWLTAFTGIAALCLVFCGFPEDAPSIKWERIKPLSAAVFDWPSYFASQWDGIKAAWYAFTSLVSFRAEPKLTFEGATVVKTLYRVVSYPLITLFILALRRAFRR